MSIKIPVSADFDPSAIEAQLQQFREKLNALGQQISAANKVQFEPVSKTSLDDLRKMTAQFEALKRVSGDLNRRVNATGRRARVSSILIGRKCTLTSTRVLVRCRSRFSM